MPLGLSRHLYIIFLSLAAALPQQDSSPALPSSLQSSDIPRCAQSCLGSAIYDTFSLACSTSPGIDCLCSEYSTRGFTLGEAALSCVLSDCLPDDQDIFVYNICDSRSEAAVPTHDTLTVTTTPRGTPATSTVAPTRDAGNDSIEDVVTTEPAASTSRSTMSMPAVTLLTDEGTASPFSAEATSSSTSTALASPLVTSEEEEKPSLSTAQIVGISVAALASVILAVGAIVVLSCVRRRQQHHSPKNEETSLDMPKQRSISAPRPLLIPVTKQYKVPEPSKDPRGGAGGVGVANVQKVQGGGIALTTYGRVPQPPSKEENAPHKPQSQQQRQQQAPTRPQRPQLSLAPPPVRSDDIGLAISPGLERFPSPTSNKSSSTVSKLLPEKPDLSKMPLPPRPVRDSTASQTTVFEEDTRASRTRSQMALSRGPPVMEEPLHSPVALQYTQLVGDFPRDSRESPNMYPPPLSIKIPKRESTAESPQQIPTKEAYAQPKWRSLARPGSGASGRRRDQSASRSQDHRRRSAAGIPYVLTHPNDSTCTEDSEMSTRPPRAARKQGPFAVKSSRASSVSNNRDSYSSMTSFESADSNDPTPPEEEERQLSPVAESPISGLKYPKVPRSSNQAVPRSPSKKDQFQEQVSKTLLAKRRGEDAAHELERRLWITDSNTGSMRSSAATMHHHRRGASNGTTGSEHSTVGPLGQHHHSKAARRYSHTRYSRSMDGGGGPPSREPEMELMSPLWEPKLTPSRKGDELYIHVG
ncbi:hypothetical protein BDY21DRAFT_355553 [Lineolata rhizophorae]|uniref:Extracellular membrane protein CFEM domain-containing protein n=1 Tax=Lineolata rhizophorae TaxID=578093 RepID=A0A6A6NQC8_9PEZI|nr:hypothetical protein BDY21DRAFT_355553 [Lineolata rhizophorae]